MGSIGFPEIMVILLVALLIFGPKKLPEIGRTLGSAMRELKKAARDFTDSVQDLDVREDIKSVQDDLKIDECSNREYERESE
jgi:TatA/E family protein of Tat protein translocase